MTTPTLLDLVHPAEGNVGHTDIDYIRIAIAAVAAIAVIAVVVWSRREQKRLSEADRRNMSRARALDRKARRNRAISGITILLLVGAGVASAMGARQEVAPGSTADEPSGEEVPAADVTEGPVALRFVFAAANGALEMEAENRTERQLFAQCLIDALGPGDEPVVQGEFKRVTEEGELVETSAYAIEFNLGPKGTTVIESTLDVSAPVRRYSAECNEIVNIPEEWNVGTSG